MAETTKVVVTLKEQIVQVNHIGQQGQPGTTDYNQLQNKPDLSVFLEENNIIEGDNISIERDGNNLTISSTSQAGGTFQNTGVGIGVYTSSIDGVISLKSIKSLTDAILVTLNSDAIALNLDQTKIVIAQSQVANLSANLATINSQISVLNGFRTTQLGINTINTNNFISINNQISNINTTLTILDQNGTNLYNFVVQVNDRVNTLETQVFNINNTIDDINTELETINTNISDLQSQVDAIDILHVKGDILVHNGTSYQRLPIGTDNQVLTAKSSASNGLDWETPSGGGGGGLVNWTENINTAGSKEIVDFSVIGALSSIDAAIIPKGNGSFALSYASTTRGAKSVDLQLQKSNGTQTTQGAFSGLFAGFQNIVAGTGSVFAGGNSNVNNQGDYVFGAGSQSCSISGSQSYVIGSTSCTIGSTCGNSGIIGSNGSGIADNSTNATIFGSTSCTITSYAINATILGCNVGLINQGAYACLLGGASNTISGFTNYSVILGGSNNIINSYYATIINGKYNRINATQVTIIGSYGFNKGIKGGLIFSGASSLTNLADGKSQEMELKLLGQTTSTTQYLLTSDNSGTASNDNQFSLLDGEIKVIAGTIVIVDINSNLNYAEFDVDVTVSRNSTNIYIDKNLTQVSFTKGTSLTDNYDVIVSADNTNFAVSFYIKHDSGNEVKAVAILRAVEFS